MSNLRIVVDQQDVQPPTVVVRLHGPLDTVAAYTFQEKMHALIQSGVVRFIIDFEQLEYISSAGIGVFPGMATELQSHDGHMIFVHVPEKTYKLFEMIGLTALFTITDTVDEAMKEFGTDD